MAIRNNFRAESYQWIEKFIHAIAWCFPFVVCVVGILAERFNPLTVTCGIAFAPQGCEDDPDLPCQRGKLKYFLPIISFSLVFLYLIFPPSILTTMFCWVRKIKQSMEGSFGMQQIRARARSQMLKNMAIQMSVYLLSLWMTWLPRASLYAFARWIAEELLYDLVVFTHCLSAVQGLVLAVAYFTLPKLATQKPMLPRSRVINRRERTVSDIRADVASRETSVALEPNEEPDFVFDIFDGTPDPDSPWARFIDEGPEQDCGADVSTED